MINNIQIAKQAFGKNRLNSFCYENALAKGASLTADDVSALILFSKEDVKTEDELKLAASIYNILSFSHGSVSEEIFKQAYGDASISEVNTSADLYQIVLEACQKKGTFNKKAYPNGSGALSPEIESESDLVRWGNIVKQIYNASLSGEIDVDQGIRIAQEKLNKANPQSKEGDRFMHWVNYYKNGEHLKYSAEKGKNMYKKANYQFSPKGSQQYSGTPDLRQSTGNDILDIFAANPDVGIFESKVLDAKHETDKKNDYKAWKSKLHTAIRRIDKLIRNSDGLIEPEITERLSEILHSFDLQVGRTKLHTTASDLTFKTAQQFKKLGFDAGSNILIKVAQQTPPVEEPVAPAEIMPETVEAPQAPAAEGQLQEAGVQTEESAGEEQPQSKPNMYGKEFSLDDAVEKLDEVSNMLADRAVIRMLSEFDIILDSIGIASMFPELAEAQSKLIDGYSYALTRVTKMMGMIGSGRTLSELAREKQDSLDAKAEGLAERELAKGKESSEKEEEPSPQQKEFGNAPVAPPAQTV